MNVKVKVSAPVYPTEIREKVKTAITNLFPLKLHVQENGIPRIYGNGDIESLRKLHLLLREQRILDTARSILLAGIEGNTISFRLSKQVAFTGWVNFPPADESLGSMDVKISTENAEDLMHIIDWLAPQTIEGRPVKEIEL